jgi:hypothetical protein
MASRGVLVVSLVSLVVAFSMLAAGCGGGGPSGVASIGTSTITPTAVSTTTVEAGSRAGALAFARCMRSHGIPSFPDPTNDGGFDKAKLRALGVSPSRMRAIEESSCNYDFQNGSQAQSITPAEQTDYLRAAACMRSHGFPGFPDPTFTDGNVRVSIPPAIDQDSSRFRNAATTCARLLPAGLPYSRPSHQG